MTVATTGYTNSYTGNGATTTFSFNKWLRDKSDLIVTIDDVVQTITTHYTIAGTGPYPSGQDVVFITPPASGETVLLTRATPDTQDVNFTNVGSFDQESIELALDKVIANIQETSGTLDDAVLVPSSLAGTNIRLPAPVANELIAWNSGATAFVNTGTTITAFNINVANAATSATNAATSASNAATSATNAATSSSNASTSATNAATSETNAAASAALAATTATNLAATLSGNYISPSEPTLDVNDRFTVTEQMKAFMITDAIAYIPTSGLTVTWHAWLFNGINGNWSTGNCKIESTTYTVETANGVSLGTGVIDIDHGNEPLFLYYSVNANKVIVARLGGGV